MANLINNSDDGSDITIPSQFNRRVQRDYENNYQNEFRHQITAEIREELLDQHQRDLRMVYKELDEVNLKLSAVRRQLLRAHTRIRTLPLPLELITYTTNFNTVPYNTTVQNITNNYERNLEYLNRRVDTLHCPTVIVIEYHTFLELTEKLPKDPHEYINSLELEESYL